MKCTSCGEFIYKRRKFNARKETTEEKYYSIAIYRFYIRCTRCSEEIKFKTDPKGMNYTCERGAKRNFEVWRKKKAEKQKTEKKRLDRLERKKKERSAISVLESKTVDAKRKMAIADALDGGMRELREWRMVGLGRWGLGRRGMRRGRGSRERIRRPRGERLRQSRERR